MQTKTLSNGAVRILLTDRELAHFHVDFSAMRENDPKTAAMLRRILKAAYPAALLTVGQHLLVEAAPIDGGCLLLITPKDAREDGVLCLCAKDGTALSQLIAAAHRVLGGNAGAAVYRFHERYYLLLYGAPFPAAAVSMLSEFAVGERPDRLKAARVLEYGTPLVIGGTLSSLTADVSDG